MTRGMEENPSKRAAWIVRRLSASRSSRVLSPDRRGTFTTNIGSDCPSAKMKKMMWCEPCHLGAATKERCDGTLNSSIGSLRQFFTRNFKTIFMALKRRQMFVYAIESRRTRYHRQ